MTSRPLIVIGSANMDLVARVPHLPAPGETLRADQFNLFPGGKGANQAVAAARAGYPTQLLARVGGDAFGQALLRSLKGYGVSPELIMETPDASSGIAMIHVDAQAENSITIFPGANDLLTTHDLIRHEETIAGAALLLVQLETPLATVAEAIRLGRKHNVPVMLDPAPAPQDGLPDGFFDVEYISPNQSEAQILTGIPVNDHASSFAAARALQARGARHVIMKLGALGAMLVEPAPAEPIMIPAFKVNPIDTTGAGDAFTAVTAVGLCEGLPLREAITLGCAAGGLATQSPGAQAAMPTRAAIDDLIAL